MAKTTQWQCRIEATEPITVGAPFVLSCQGEENQLKREALNLRRPKEAPYALKILKVDELEATSLKLAATTYVAGEGGTEVAGYALTDGENTIEIAPIKLATQSVITQENNPESKPFPPVGAAFIAYPLWVWVLLAAAAALVVGSVGILWYRSHQRKRFLRELADRSSALAPYHQLQKELRQLTRTLPIANTVQWTPDKTAESISTLNQSYRWFLAREFKVPAHQWPIGLVTKEIKRVDRKLYKNTQAELLLADRELIRAAKNSGRMSLNDFQQLLELVRKGADKVHIYRSQESRR